MITPHVHVLTTGGCIEMSYDEQAQELGFEGPSPIPEMIRIGRLPKVSVQRLFAIDSLDMNDGHREKIVEAIRGLHPALGSVVVTHGTDTMQETGRYLQRNIGLLGVRRIVLTGAMRPYCFTRSDALSNLGSAITIARQPLPNSLTADVSIVMNGLVLNPRRAEEQLDDLTFQYAEVLGPRNYARAAARHEALLGARREITDADLEQYIQDSKRYGQVQAERAAELDALYPPVF